MNGHVHIQMNLHVFSFFYSLFSYVPKLWTPLVEGDVISDSEHFVVDSEFM